VLSPVGRLFAVLCFALAGGTIATGAHAENALRLGLLPYISPRQLVETYKPLKMHLEQTLNRPVILETARNFSEFALSATRYEYDIYYAPPHFALLAEQESGYRRLAKFSVALYGAVLVRKDGPVQEPAELRNRKIAMPDFTAAVTFLGESWLRDEGLTPGQDVHVEYFVSHSNALMAVLNRSADAAVLAPSINRATPPNQRENLRELARTASVARTMFMASPKLAEEEYQQIRLAMLAFTPQGTGKDFFARTGYGDINEITDADMDSVRGFIPLLKSRSQHKNN